LRRAGVTGGDRVRNYGGKVNRYGGGCPGRREQQVEMGPWRHNCHGVREGKKRKKWRGKKKGPEPEGKRGPMNEYGAKEKERRPRQNKKKKMDEPR